MVRRAQKRNPKGPRRRGTTRAAGNDAAFASARAPQPGPPPPVYFQLEKADSRESHGPVVRGRGRSSSQAQSILDAAWVDAFGAKRRGEAIRGRLAARIPVVGPAFPSFSRDELIDIQARAARRDASYRPAGLERYRVVSMPDHPGVRSDRLVASLLKRRGSVAAAYVGTGKSDPPSLVAESEPRWVSQAAFRETGIDVDSAWGRRGGKGRGVCVVDVEYGWHFSHEDLRLTQSKTLMNGNNYPEIRKRAHGTSVLGTIMARVNRRGGVGAAYEAKVRAVSIFRKRTPRIDHSGDAILFAGDRKKNKTVREGDVVLLELTTSKNLPIEFEKHCFDAIRIVTALGLIVVEAAGNANRDLDKVMDSKRRLVLNPRRSGHFRGDSGAILVGGCKSDAPHARWSFPGTDTGSNHGARVDCCAWAENVAAPGAQGDASRSAHTDTFEATSAAAALVAALVACMQGVWRASRGALTPREVRQRLRKCGPHIRGIGPMATLGGRGVLPPI